MIKDDLQTKVVEQAALIAAALKKGKDVEVRRTAAGISVESELRESGLNRR